MDGHRVVAGAAGSCVVLHVPHASWTVPPDVRDQLLLDDVGLAAELARMTDAHTDVIAGSAAAASVQRPWSLVNELSRLVVDPERFPDEREQMRSVGMGAVYTRTSDGAALRAKDPAAERELVARWFEPYAAAMTDLVEARLSAAGRVTIIDVHSYPSQRLPYELGGTRRPQVCLGTDETHTPDWLLAAARTAFGPFETEADTPFAGCYVPLRHYGRDARVSALMVEIRRDTYMAEPGGPPHAGVASIAACLTTLINSTDVHT